MSSNFPSWLTKQMVRGVRGFNLDAYLVALEGWRRGLSLTWYLDPSKVTDLKLIGFNPLGKSFSLSSKEKTHFFYRSRGDQVANEAVDIGTDKQQTIERLHKAEIPVPEGKGFDSQASVDQIIDYGLSLGFPLVVKPTFGSLGKGITTNITTEKHLREGIKHTRDIGYEEVIVEQHIQGNDYRLYVIDDQVVGATQRLPANITGDGINTIEQLIELKNEQRKKNPYLKNKLIKIDEDLKRILHKSNFALKDIPSNDERVFLREVSNISAGGDPTEAMDRLSPEIKEMAINAVKAIPGLVHAGVDMSLSSSEDLVVIEVSTTPDISMYMFPFEGEPVNICEKIINFYFPGTKMSELYSKKVYFDYNDIYRLFKNRSASKYKVTDAPLGYMYSKQYTISGKVQKVGYRNWVRNEARKHGLHGYIRNHSNGNVVVVVGGTDKNKVNYFRNICKTGPKRSVVKDIHELEWNEEIKVGFEVRNNNAVNVKDETIKKVNGEGTVSLTAVGDILLHGRVYGGLKKRADFKFLEQLKNVGGILGKTDITIANLESIIAGQEIGLSSFPKFNGPVEIGYALKEMGVDIVTIANNHILDRGEKGLLKSIENLERIGLEYDGAYKSVQDSERLRIKSMNGLRICFVSYTRGTNGIKLPQGKGFLVNSLPKTTTLRISKKLRKIKRDKLADVIIVNLHFGEEYHLNPSNEQKKLVASLSDAGADVIIGHHPHVIQPPEWIENSQGTKSFVAYSLGNFFTGQNGLHRQIGAALSLEISKPNKDNKEVIIKKPKYELTYTNRTSRLRYDIHLLRDWIKENEYIETAYGKFNAREIYANTKNRLRKNIDNLEII